MSFAITEKAAVKIKEISDEEGIGHYCVRVKLKGSGCAGYVRELDFENSPRETDEIITLDDVKILIDEVSFQYLNETTLDYEGSLMGGGFKFSTPNATGQCGCGKSISF